MAYPEQLPNPSDFDPLAPGMQEETLAPLPDAMRTGAFDPGLTKMMAEGGYGHVVDAARQTAGPAAEATALAEHGYTAPTTLSEEVAPAPPSTAAFDPGLTELLTHGGYGNVVQQAREAAGPEGRAAAEAMGLIKSPAPGHTAVGGLHRYLTRFDSKRDIK